mmetsp:Transcript_55226/g.131647  ORF Transcript_55226/g.131647 Transcript_55226/m.131647 type:complete len:284 (+) Transcript_55226:76-927(+)
MPSKVVKSACAGSLAGFAESIAVCPTDVVKTRFQAKGYQNNGIVHAFRSVVQQEGFLAFYKGLGPTMLTIAPKVTLQWGGMAFFKPMFEGKAPALLVPSLAGICTGILQAVVFLTPAEVIKVRQQTQLGWGGKYDSTLSTARLIMREEGFGAFYNGLAATIARQSWGLVVKFSGYEGLKALFQQMQGNDSLAGWQHAAAGGMTNIAVAVLNSPPDVVKTRLQDASGSGKAYSSTWNCIQRMWMEEGVMTFFRGSVMRMARIAPGGAVQFGVYGKTMDYLEKNW